MEVGKPRVRFSELGLRLLAFSLTAAIVIAVGKQTKIVAGSLSFQLSLLSTYLVVGDAIACAYAIISLVLITLASKGGNKGGLTLMITTFDLVMVALLYSGSGATTAVSLIALKGNSHAQWKKQCNVFGKFCHQMLAGLVLSLVASTIFLLISALNLQN
ncbi:hypothetical protein Vadar_034371 [Vaccinium darrowii]|uniref:Uncharacterized protein n=1 Tax=Vaccinium darrowii TaxID=229202 RepID=A0ACB7XWR8_9ERIC|nr:hypothetical protein Vadar_034371 [Vaccinium darrowii]